MSHVLRAAALLGLALCTACPSSTAVPPKPKVTPDVLAEKLPNMPNGHPDLGSLSVASRAPRRLSVHQLERSLDSIGEFPPGSIDLGALALTLGEPDYDRVTEESLDPSPLYMKFGLDLGVFFCNALSDYEAQRPAAERVMTRFPTVEENLAFLLFRFTSLEGEAAADYLPRLKAAYDRGAKSVRPLGGYEAACISLFTSPEFLLF
jgi:hypothetical protein